MPQNAENTNLERNIVWYSGIEVIVWYCRKTMGFSEEQSSKGLPLCSVDCMEGTNEPTFVV
jgi:hypothetical protein